MLKAIFRCPMWIVLGVMVLWLGSVEPLRGQQDAAAPLDVVVKLSGLNQTLDLVDGFMAAATTQPAMVSPTAMVRGMLQGTDWIDPARQIVLGVDLKGGQPALSVLIPFQSPNENFQAAMGASVGPDYYLLQLPPGPAMGVDAAVEKTLAAASLAAIETTFAVELAVPSLLEHGQPYIQLAMAKLDAVDAGTQAPSDMTPTTEDMRTMFTRFLEVASELDLIVLGLDLTAEAIAARFDMHARPASRLYGLFTPPASQPSTAAYRPEHQIRFHSRSYDMGKMMELANTVFGAFYQKMGLDFEGLTALGNHFSGEIAGGMSQNATGVDLDLIMVLKESAPADTFLEEIYMPWLIGYGESMAAMMESQLGQKMDPSFVRTADSTVAGVRVLGVRSQMPTMPGAPQNAATGLANIANYDMRMAVVGRYLLAASDDDRLGSLIQTAQKLQPAPPQGALMTMDVALGDYMTAVQAAVPELAAGIPEWPQLGDLHFEFDLAGGRASSLTTVQMEDIQKMVALAQSIQAIVGSKVVKPAAEPKAAEPAQPTELKIKTQPAAESTSATAENTDNADYWSEKAALCAAYGNDRAAVRYYRKVIQMEPRRSEAHFHLGISLGELGEFEPALAAINRAVALADGNPHKQGLYYYGRGRVRLLTGDEAGALEDMQRAAYLGDPDAGDYVQSLPTGGAE